MKPFVFSADSHIMEPADIFRDGLPASLRKYAIHTWQDGEFRLTGTEDKVIYRLRTGKHRETELGDTTRKGIREIPGRLEDMELEGIDAEICFPSLGLWLYALDNPEAEAASARLYNDWNDSFLGGHPNRFVRCGMLPVLDFSNTLAELDYLAAKGFTSAMLPATSPTGMPKYNDEKWDPIFAKGAEHGIVFVMHTGTGLETVIPERGPGGGNINYTKQMNDAQNTAMYLVAGGVLDRNPGAHILFAEHSAGWLWGLAERMDEVYHGHAPSIEPKLSRLPSQIVRDQVHCALQNDGNSSMAIRHGVGIGALLFATDYPHAEGTFPFSRQVVDQMIAANPDVTTDELVAVLGGNAARLFTRANLGAQVEARRAQLLAAA